MYIVQLYKEDRGILCMLGCQAVALPSTEQIVAQVAAQSNVASPTLPKPQGVVYPMTTPL